MDVTNLRCWAGKRLYHGPSGDHSSSVDMVSQRASDMFGLSNNPFRRPPSFHAVFGYLVSEI
ncbi:hypothetical protein T4D_12842 [Trichinella pseudospiralis]|uniref:Uncharacterized protein n=1 Tax=Trichinella pseudospiralis TaxID=6337 RepID=A0A0V1FDV3_TRIPS|nr:hypothetical protein T4D_12842 [Trichinella pseudospiralis]